MNKLLRPLLVPGGAEREREMERVVVVRAASSRSCSSC